MSEQWRRRGGVCSGHYVAEVILSINNYVQQSSFSLILLYWRDRITSFKSFTSLLCVRVPWQSTSYLIYNTSVLGDPLKQNYYTLINYPEIHNDCTLLTRACHQFRA